MTESSTVDTATPETGAADTPVSDVNTADSSAADAGAKSMLDAVQAALKPDEGSEPSPGSQAPEKSSAAEADAGKDGDGRKEGEIPPLSDEERRSVSAKTAKRFDQLLTSNRSLRSDMEKIQAEHGAVKTKAESYDRLNGYLASNGLTSEDVDKGFAVMAALKSGDARKAWEAIAPIYEQLRGVVGEGELPADLAEKVRLGYVDEPTARELARTRANIEQSNKKAETQRVRSEQEQHRRVVTEMVETAKSTANAWEEQQRKVDPDWHLKQERVHEKIKLALFEGNGANFPKTKEATTKMLDGILSDVNKDLRRFSPRPTRVDPPVSGRASSKSVSEPKTMLEAIQLGMSSGR